MHTIIEVPPEMCCIPVSGLLLGHGGAGLPFGNDMVLQHGRPVGIFGLARAGVTVTVTYNGHAHTAIAGPDPWDVPESPMAANVWRVELPPQPRETTSLLLTSCLSVDNTCHDVHVVS